MAETGNTAPDALTVFDWICAIRRAKLPDPARHRQRRQLLQEPGGQRRAVPRHHRPRPRDRALPLPDGTVKLAAGWLIDACGWKGKSVGRAGVYEKQALVLVNRGGASGAEVVTLARAIQESVYGRFGIRLEPEPVIL